MPCDLSINKLVKYADGGIPNINDSIAQFNETLKPHLGISGNNVPVGAVAQAPQPMQQQAQPQPQQQPQPQPQPQAQQNRPRPFPWPVRFDQQRAQNMNINPEDRVVFHDFRPAPWGRIELFNNRQIMENPLFRDMAYKMAEVTRALNMANSRVTSPREKARYLSQARAIMNSMPYYRNPALWMRMPWSLRAQHHVLQYRFLHSGKYPGWDPTTSFEFGPGLNERLYPEVANQMRQMRMQSQRVDPWGIRQGVSPWSLMQRSLRPSL